MLQVDRNFIDVDVAAIGVRDARQVRRAVVPRDDRGLRRGELVRIGDVDGRVDHR